MGTSKKPLARGPYMYMNPCDVLASDLGEVVQSFITLLPVMLHTVATVDKYLARGLLLIPLFTDFM